VKGLEGFADLDNNIKGIVRQIVDHFIHYTVLFFVAKSVDGKSSISEVAVLVILEH
jgi:hypothetical protein